MTLNDSIAAEIPGKCMSIRAFLFPSPCRQGEDEKADARNATHSIMLASLCASAPPRELFFSPTI